MFDADEKSISLLPKKQQYLKKLTLTLAAGWASSKDLEKILGYLVWAGYAEPIGRPFISIISAQISRTTPHNLVQLTGELRTAI